MRKTLIVIILLCAAALYADGTIAFRIAGRSYQLSGGHGVIAKRNGKTQLVLAVKDTENKAQFALTAELPADLTGPVELTAEVAPMTAVIVSNRGIFSYVPQVTLARDDFMRYTKQEITETDELEDDPEDRPELRLAECRHHHDDKCERAMRDKRLKRKKISVRYIKHGPTWVGKSRQQRIDQGDGVAREQKYSDTSLFVRVTPVLVNGKVASLTGSFSGIVVYNEGMNSGKKVPLENGTFSVTVQNLDK